MAVGTPEKRVSSVQQKPDKPSGTWTRVRSGLIAFAVLVVILLFGGFWGILLLAAGAVTWAMWEFVRMALPDRPLGTTVVATGLALLLMLAVAFGRFEWLAAAVAVVFFGSILWWVFTVSSLETMADRGARLIIGVIWIGALIGFLPLLRDGDNGARWMWLAMGLGWTGDIGGYFAGRALGRHKMAPRISPKKTWEGFVGGVLLAIIWAALFKLLFFPEMRPLDCVALAILGDIAGVLGDLVESVFKRTFRVKDSGSFLPGHGGFLDRVDSVMFSIPVTYLYVTLVVPAAG
jgi:phosphatidate cytidylyltransferase